MLNVFSEVHMVSSPSWLKIVQFVREDLGWSLDAQAAATGLSSTTIHYWSRGETVPSMSAWGRYLQFILSLASVRNYSQDGCVWALQSSRTSSDALSYRHQIFLLQGPKSWLLIYFFDGNLVDVDSGAFAPGRSLQQLHEELAEVSFIRAVELEELHTVSVA